MLARMPVCKGKASIKTVFSGLTASSRGWGPVGGGHRQRYVISDGGVLRVDPLMVQEPARSSLLSFPSSLHHHEEKTNGVWMAFLRFDNAQAMRMLSRRLTEH